MSFAINPSLSHIDIPESLVHELYRSSAEVLLPDARFHGHTCEAYICIAKNEMTVKAYVALLETGMKTVFVYTSEYSVSEPAHYPKVYAQAEDFVKKMGFAMEPVNLNFSPAMREVIIKGFRVLRPPPQKKPPLRQMKPAVAAEPRKLRETAPLPASPVSPAVSSDLSTELESLQRELTSAKAAIAKITREKVSLEQSAASEIASLKASCAQAVAATQKVEELFAAEAEKLKQAQQVRANLPEDEEKTALRASLEAARAAESRFLEELTALQQKTAQLERDNLSLEQQFATAAATNADTVKRLTDEQEALLTRLAGKENAAISAADRIAFLESFETAWKEGQQREEDLCRDLDLLHNQLDTLGKELQTQRNRGDREEELQLRVNTLEEELAVAQAEIDAIGSRVIISESVAAELKELQEAKQAVETEYVRMANESRERELEMLDAVAAAETEIEHLTSEMEIQAQVASMEHEALRAELRRQVVARTSSGPALPAAIVPAAKAAAEDVPVVAVQPVTATAAPAADEQKEPSPPAALPTVTPPAEPETIAPEPSPPTEPAPPALPVQSDKTGNEPLEIQGVDDEPDRPITSDKAVASKLLNEFGGFSGSSGNESSEFKVDPTLSAIDYSDPAEIEALLYSINTVQAVPDSSSIQRCKGYVVATIKEGIYKVYVAWYLTESKRVVICTPQQQPADSEECIRILQDAVAYFEVVGFMMEVADLGETAHSYYRALKQAPVFRKMNNR